MQKVGKTFDHVKCTSLDALDGPKEYDQEVLTFWVVLFFFLFLF